MVQGYDYWRNHLGGDPGVVGRSEPMAGVRFRAPFSLMDGIDLVCSGDLLAASTHYYFPDGW